MVSWQLGEYEGEAGEDSVKSFCDIVFSIVHGDFCTYSIIDENKEHRIGRVRLTTPFGEYTPAAREVVSLELIQDVVRKYYESEEKPK